MQPPLPTCTYRRVGCANNPGPPNETGIRACGQRSFACHKNPDLAVGMPLPDGSKCCIALRIRPHLHGNALTKCLRFAPHVGRDRVQARRSGQLEQETLILLNTPAFPWPHLSHGWRAQLEHELLNAGPARCRTSCGGTEIGARGDNALRAGGQWTGEVEDPLAFVGPSTCAGDVHAVAPQLDRARQPGISDTCDLSPETNDNVLNRSDFSLRRNGRNFGRVTGRADQKRYQ